MKIVVIGATGHVGSYLVKALVEENHEVYAITRGKRQAYGYDEKIWNKVRVIKMDKTEVGSSGVFDEVRRTPCSFKEQGVNFSVLLSGLTAINDR
jgi:nucleoside-diphosphate-sugar epimerase